jgi:hypothetical protein
VQFGQLVVISHTVATLIWHGVLRRIQPLLEKFFDANSMVMTIYGSTGKYIRVIYVLEQFFNVNLMVMSVL